MSASASARGRAARGISAAPARTTRALTPGESAWLAALPCALLTLFAIVVLGPPLGRALPGAPHDETVWGFYARGGFVRPEPIEHARYLIALVGPPLLAATVLLRGGWRVRIDVARIAVGIAQVALAAFVLVGVVAQQRNVYGAGFTLEGTTDRIALLTPATLLAAATIALLAALALRRRALVERIGRALRETPAKRAAASAVAGLLVLLWLLTAFNTDATIERANGWVVENIPFWSDEAFAVLGGHAPLVDFHAQYGQLWAYLAAGGMAAFGASLGVYCAIMLAGTAATMAAVYATLRRLTHSSLAALVLFAPFLATSFFNEGGTLANRYGPASLFSLFPIRYAGPYVLLWLVVRRVQRGTTRAPLALFAFAGIVAINNLEFGLPAFAASLVALAAVVPERSPPALARLAGAALGGVAAAVVLVCALTLAVAGSLPHFGMLTTFPRIYAVTGLGMLPMRALGLHLVVYATLAAALVVAAVRVASGTQGLPLTAALAWTGLFGLGAGGYFVGRSHPHVLVDLFSAWALALVLLALVVVPAVLRRSSRRPQLAELLVLAGLGVAICSLPQTPTPWSQIRRLGAGVPADRQVARIVTGVVGRMTHRGQPVALLLMLGHRMAYQLGLDDVTPYANIDSITTVAQWRETLAALRRAHGTTVLTPRTGLFPEAVAFLAAAGFRAERESPAGVGIVEFTAR